jgi:hypothetical protein
VSGAGSPEDAIRDLLDAREAGTTICPSEAARLLARQAGEADLWRTQMDAVHRAVDALVEAGEIRLSWKGDAMEKRRGPYRIARR